MEAVGNDLNTASGLTVLYDLLKDDRLYDGDKYSLAVEFDRVLSLDLARGLPEAEVDQELAELVKRKIEERARAKKERILKRRTA